MHLSAEQLATGSHEKCAWCRAPFVWSNGAWDRYKALDGKYYCQESHASAPYLTPRTRIHDVTKW